MESTPRSVRAALAAAGLAFALSSAASAVPFTLVAGDVNFEVRPVVPGSSVARDVYLCPTCTVATWPTVIPPAGAAMADPRLMVPSEGTIELGSPPPGIPAALDLSPTIAGSEMVWGARLLTASPIGFDPVLGVFLQARVQRQTVLTYSAGSTLHQLTDPSGGTWTLFTLLLSATTMDPAGAGTIDPTVVGSLSGLALPAGWSYSSEVLTSDLVLDTAVTGGVADVFAQGPVANWQRTVLPEPGSLAALAAGACVVALRRGRAIRRR